MMDEIGPGMVCKRRCPDCGGPLAVDDGERCASCRPQLSVTAQVMNDLRRDEHDRIRAMELAAMEIEVMIRRLDRKVRLNGYLKRAQGHGRHPQQIAGSVEAGGRAQDKLIGGALTYQPRQSGAGDIED